MIKRHTKPNPQRQIQGGVVEREAPIALCKLMLIDPDGGKPTRVGWKRSDDGTVTRIAKSSGVDDRLIRASTRIRRWRRRRTRKPPPRRPPAHRCGPRPRRVSRRCSRRRCARRS